MEIVCINKTGKANIDKGFCSWYTTNKSLSFAAPGITIGC